MKHTLKTVGFAVICIIVVGFVANTSLHNARAQALSGLGSQSLRMSAQPELPRAYSTVSLKLSSLATSLPSSNISWYKNDTLIEAGTGNTNIQIEVGALGEAVELEAVVESADGVFRATKVITPAEVDLVWESSSYTPGWYRGRSHLTSRNSVTFMAIPHLVGAGGERLSPNNLVYTWRRNGRVVENVSGYGKQSFTTTTDILNTPLEITVEVEATDNSIKAISSTSILPKQPQVIIYSESPLYGIFSNMAVGERFAMTEEEVTFVAIPMFFSTSGDSRSISYNWSVNGKTIVAQGNRATFRAAEESGSAQVGIVARNTEHITQEDRRQYSILFGDIDD